MPRRILALIALALGSALATGCNTWHGAKQDARIVGDKAVEGGKAVGHAVGTGLEKAGEGIEKAGEKVQEASKP